MWTVDHYPAIATVLLLYSKRNCGPDARLVELSVGFIQRIQEAEPCDRGCGERPGPAGPRLRRRDWTSLIELGLRS